MKQATQRNSRRARVVAAMMLGSSLVTAQAWAIDSAVKEVRGPIWKTVPAAAGTLQSIRVTAPANGYVTVTATGTTNFEHTLGVAGNWCLDLHTSANYVGGCTPNAGSDSAIRSYIPTGYPTTTPGFGASDPYSIVRTWPVVAGQVYAFYLNGYAVNLGATYLFHPTLTVIFNPRALP